MYYEFVNYYHKFLLSQQVSKFSNDVASYIIHSEASPGGWYWPLVKSVTFKVPDCHNLLEHIVLVDIPGSGDCNKLRDDKWKSVRILLHSIPMNFWNNIRTVLRVTT